MSNPVLNSTEGFSVLAITRIYIHQVSANMTEGFCKFPLTPPNKNQG